MKISQCKYRKRKEEWKSGTEQSEFAGGQRGLRARRRQYWNNGRWKEWRENPSDSRQNRNEK